MIKIFNTREDLFKSFQNGMEIAEIGVFKGEFSKFIFNELKPKKLFLIDLFVGYAGSGDKDGNNMQFTHLENEYQLLTEFFSKNNEVKIHKTTSIDFLNSVGDESLDLIYIDAEHTYESVSKELEISFDKIKKGGHICGHDYVSPRFEGVVKAVDDFCKIKNLSIEYLTKDGCPSYCIIKK